MVQRERQSGMICCSCESSLPLSVVDAQKPFQCPTCHAVVRVPERYKQWLAAVSMLIDIGIAYVFGLEGMRFVVAVVVGFFPVMLTAALFAHRLIPPTLIASRH